MSSSSLLKPKQSASGFAKTPVHDHQHLDERSCAWVNKQTKKLHAACSWACPWPLPHTLTTSRAKGDNRTQGNYQTYLNPSFPAGKTPSFGPTLDLLLATQSHRQRRPRKQEETTTTTSREEEAWSSNWLSRHISPFQCPLQFSSLALQGDRNRKALRIPSCVFLHSIAFGDHKAPAAGHTAYCP